MAGRLIQIMFVMMTVVMQNSGSARKTSCYFTNVSIVVVCSLPELSAALHISVKRTPSSTQPPPQSNFNSIWQHSYVVQDPLSIAPQGRVAAFLTDTYIKVCDTSLYLSIYDSRSSSSSTNNEQLSCTHERPSKLLPSQSNTSNTLRFSASFTCIMSAYTNGESAMSGADHWDFDNIDLTPSPFTRRDSVDLASTRYVLCIS